MSGGWICHADSVFPAGLSWTISKHYGDWSHTQSTRLYDILTAHGVQRAEGNPLVYGLKVKKLDLTANVRAVLGLTSLLITTLYIDQSYDGLWVSR